MEVTVLVRNITKEAFEMGMKLISIEQDNFKCDGYKIIDGELFLSRYSDKCVKFPYKYNLQQTIEFAWGWFEANKKPIKEEPDTDGHTRVAFELTTEKSGVGSYDWGMFCSVKPIWFVYGK